MDIRENSFFDPFSKSSADRLAASASCRVYQDGALIFDEKDRADGIYLVLSGVAEMVKSARAHPCIPLSRVEAGDYFGEVGVIDGSGRSTGARAAGYTEIAVVSSESLMDALRAEPVDVALHFCKRVSGYLRATDRRFVEEVLNKERMQLLGEMARSIIHDFKNPMTSIQLAADLIEHVSADSGIAESCALITAQVKRMVSMAEELLDFSRGSTDIRKAPVTLSALFADIRMLNGDFLRSRKVELEIEPSELNVDVDRDRIIRVFQNLISNAVEAMEPDGGTLAVNLTGTDDNFAVVAVSDTGPGIPDEICDTIFEPFVTFGKKKGTGIGMAIVKTVVEAHGGRITFESEKGKGTTFLVKLPLHKEKSGLE